MKTLFDKDAYDEITGRIAKLSAATNSKWGKMDVSQMLAHCAALFKVSLSQTRMPRMFLGRLIGWMIKSKLYDESAWKQGLSTSPDFMIKDQRDFAVEKTKLAEQIGRFYNAGPAGITKYPHPFFGRFTTDQWGKSMYKHLDHHLKQFGV